MQSHYPLIASEHNLAIITTGLLIFWSIFYYFASLYIIGKPYITLSKYEMVPKMLWLSLNPQVVLGESLELKLLR